MSSLSRVWRGLLALTIAGTIPLSIWGTGCDSQPLVQPDASGQSGGSPGTGGVSSGGSPGSGGIISGSGGVGGTGPRDASVDGLSPCCSQAESLATQCTPDGRQLRQCFYRLASGATLQCAGGSFSYAYIWSVQDCPNGCVMTDAGVLGTGGASGGTTGSGGNLGSGGISGAGGSSPTGGYPGTSAKCQ